MDYFIYISAPPYLADFVHNLYGSPVRLHKSSPETRIIRSYLRRLSTGERPDSMRRNNISVRLPFFKESDPRFFNHLSSYGKKELIKSFISTFDYYLFRCYLNQSMSIDFKISDFIYSFMESYGISDNSVNWYTISQRLYRLRKRHKIYKIAN
jgi:hypothetical protein